MKRCLLLVAAMCLYSTAADAQRVAFSEMQPMELELPPADLTSSSTASPVDLGPVRGGSVFDVPGRMYGHFNLPNVPGSDPPVTRRGVGYMDIPTGGPNYTTTRVFEYPSTVTAEGGILPTSGTVGPDGRLWFTGNAGGSPSQYGLYAWDLDNPGNGYETILFPLNPFFNVGTGQPNAGGTAQSELIMALNYDAASEAMTMITYLCWPDLTGTYRESLLYTIDVTTGVPTYTRDLVDPDEDSPRGACVWQATWDGENIFAVDIWEDALMQINSTTGQLVRRIEDPFLPQISFVQDGAYDPVSGKHYLVPFGCTDFTPEGACVQPIISLLYECDAASELGCELLGAPNGGDPWLETLTATFPLPKGSSSEGGATAGTVSLDIYPNPIAGQARLTLSLDQAEQVTVAVYDLLGREVLSLHSGVTAALDLPINGRALANGVYFVSARGESFSTTRKVVIAN